MNNSYRVERRENCTLIFGSVPISDLTALTRQQPKDAQLDLNLTSLFGATFVYGRPEDLKRLAAVAPSRKVDEAQAERASLSAGALQWLATGEHGLSSKTLFAVLSGYDFKNDDEERPHHPHDPSDLRRCRLMLEAAPELAARLPRMRDISPTWAALADAWETLCSTMDEESPDWRKGKGSSPQTYAHMKSIIKSIASSQRDRERQ